MTQEKILFIRSFRLDKKTLDDSVGNAPLRSRNRDIPAGDIERLRKVEGPLQDRMTASGYAMYTAHDFYRGLPSVLLVSKQVGIPFELDTISAEMDRTVLEITRELGLPYGPEHSFFDKSQMRL